MLAIGLGENVDFSTLLFFSLSVSLGDDPI